MKGRMKQKKEGGKIKEGTMISLTF